MRYVHEVIYLRPATNLGLAGSSSIYCDVCADLDVIADDYAPDMGNLAVLITDFCVAEAVQSMWLGPVFSSV